MRNLTLDEKISLKGVFAYKGLSIPKLDMASALFQWGILCGGTISKWHKFRDHKNPLRTVKDRWFNSTCRMWDARLGYHVLAKCRISTGNRISIKMP